ncbi:MAG: hypothetical protein MZV65_35195 [Chromatiales bacterium]|nr:hypothetical protein [Chromatiales bacterium]
MASARPIWVSAGGRCAACGCLLVDDNATNREILQRQMDGLGPGERR